MERNLVWCVKTHIVDDCETITNEMRLFYSKEKAKSVFDSIVEEERKMVESKGWEIDEDEFSFEAYEEGYYTQNHSCIDLSPIEIE